jgi:hypothetical protein
MIRIVGAGLAGLYAAYKLRKLGLQVIVYEKNDRIGGRIGTVCFAGRDVPTGAGVVREKDRLMKNLCAELGVELKEFTTDFKYKLPHHEDVDIWKTVCLLRERAAGAYGALDRANETFREFGTRVLGAETYRAFVAKTGYSDYESADVVDTLYNYGFEDTVPGYKAYSVDWNKLLRRLYEEIEKPLPTEPTVPLPTRTVHLNSTVARVRSGIVATDIDAARMITGRGLSGVAGHPFVRLYFSCDKDLKCGYTVCPGAISANGAGRSPPAFQKILQIGEAHGSSGSAAPRSKGPPSKGPMSKGPNGHNGPNGHKGPSGPSATKQMVYMIYCDGPTALRIARKRGDALKRYIECGVEKIFKKRISVREHKLIYWSSGTHYFTPLSAEYATREAHIAELQVLRTHRDRMRVRKPESAKSVEAYNAYKSVEAYKARARVASFGRTEGQSTRKAREGLSARKARESIGAGAARGPRTGTKYPLYIVGEAVSAHQGWCEGALESVEALIAALTKRKEHKAIDDP